MANHTIRITLPRYTHLRPSDEAVKCLFSGPDDSDYVLDADQVTFMSPVGLVWLAAAKEHLEANRGCSVRLEKVRPEVAGFLERMDFAKAVGEQLTPLGRRHPSQGRFREVTRFDAAANIDAIAKELAEVACPREDRDARSSLLYILSEVMQNAKQHSGSAAYAAAMHFPTRGTSLIGIADFGVGLESHLRRNPKLGVLLDKSTHPALDALGYALQKDTSGHPYQSHMYDALANTGNGLYYVSEICRISHGRMVLWSNRGCASYGMNWASPKWEYKLRPWLPGVLVAIELDPKLLVGYNEVMEAIRKDYSGDDRSVPIRFE